MNKSWRIIGLGLIATIFITSTIVAISSLQQQMSKVKGSFVIERWWVAGRLEQETLRLKNSLASYINMPEKDITDEVIIRFEVLWSRANITLEGVNIRQTDVIKVNHDLILSAKKLKALLTHREKFIYDLSIDKAVVLRRELSKIYPDIVAAAQEQFHSVAKVDRLEREGLKIFFTKIIILLIAISILAIAYTVLFLIELKRNKILIVVAEQATQAKSTFLAKVSHEIRTPLNCILGVMQIFENHKFDDETQDLLDDVHQSSHMLLASVNDLLDYSKLEYGGDKLLFSPVKMNELLPQILGPLVHLANAKKITLEQSIDPALPDIVLLDQQRISQVITNLVSNAIKFIRNGRVKVKVGYNPKKRRLLFKCYDSGIGISPSDATKIFAPFQQANNSTTREFGGTGLGLTISKQLIEKMSGEIGAYALDKNEQDEKNMGNCFWFEIPVDKAYEFVIDSAELEQSCSLLKDLNILVAEDNLLNQKVIATLLKQVGAQVTLAADGVIAVSLFKTSSDFDLVLLDCQMPNMDGYEACRQIRKNNANIPILAVTAHSFEEEKTKCFEAGMIGFITKPLNKALLYKTILEAMENSRKI
jgi:signal transduction histidine kinase/ActR/RegA family two-component response regulator